MKSTSSTVYSWSFLTSINFLTYACGALVKIKLSLDGLLNIIVAAFTMGYGPILTQSMDAFSNLAYNW